MKPTRRAFLSNFSVAFVLAACTPMRNSTVNPANRTTINVDNHSYLDMTIYVVRGSGRIRLGLANGATSTSFVIPADLVRTVATLRFIADPIGSSRTSISEEIDVRPGDEVVMEIPPG